MDAAGEDRDVLLQKEAGTIWSHFEALLDRALPSTAAPRFPVRRDIEAVVAQLETFQESPQLLDQHLPAVLSPLTTALLQSVRSASSASASPEAAPPKDAYTLPVALSRMLYTLCKVRGPKVIVRFLPNEPTLLEPVVAFFGIPATGVNDSWELRYVLLLWLGLLLLAPFDLSTISTDPATGCKRLEAAKLNTQPMPGLSSRLLELGMTYISSTGNRESDAAALLLIRISLRRDMRDLGLLDALVGWGNSILSDATDDAHGSLFLRTGVLTMLAGILAQGAAEEVAGFASRIFGLVHTIEDEDREEWKSASVRRLAMKVYRWAALLSLSHGDMMEEQSMLEDIIERLLGSLGDRDTAVRFGASKSLAAISRKLEPEMAGEVLEAVMGAFDEDVFYDPPIPVSGQKQRRVLALVAPEKWHGATLTLATFLRHRAVRSTEVLERVVNCIAEALSFEQRRATFALGGNVRDAACYAAWSIARSYTTKELHAVGEIVVASTGFDHGRKIPQIIATELVSAACLDPLANVRRAASAALQELVGRHPDCVTEGISLVQAVDYSAVALRRRAVIQVSKDAAVLDKEYWHGVVFGIIEGWRGVGATDEEGRRLAARCLGELVDVAYAGESAATLTDRGTAAFKSLLDRILTEGKRDVEVYHGAIWALAEVLDAISKHTDHVFTASDAQALHSQVFSKLKGREFVNPILRPELTSECTSRLTKSLAALVPSKLEPDTRSFKLWLAILEASLDRNDDGVIAQAVPAAHAIFRILSPANRKKLALSWCERIAAPSYRRRGHVLALGEVAELITDELPRVTQTLVSAATRAGEVELRVAGIKALGHESIIALSDHSILDTILLALDDYTVDTRGDVGSWVRAEAITAVLAWWRTGAFSHAAESAQWNAIGKLARLSVEKLDRIRPRAYEALREIVVSVPELAAVLTLTESAPPPGSREYFHLLIPLLRVRQVREQLLEGYVTAAGGGSDALLCASRTVLCEFVEYHGATNLGLTEAILAVLARNMAVERILVPTLDTAAMLLEYQLLPLDTADDARRLFNLAAKAHFKSSNMAKLAAAVKVYRSLGVEYGGGGGGGGGGDEVGRLVRAKLVQMLLHPFPRVRIEVAEALWVVCLARDDADGTRPVEAEMEGVDWMRGTKELVPAVRKVKRALGVV